MKHGSVKELFPGSAAVRKYSFITVSIWEKSAHMAKMCHIMISYIALGWGNSAQKSDIPDCFTLSSRLSPCVDGAF
jgi:hypothetical protein